MSEATRPLRVFLCHSSNDKSAVRRLYERLCADGVEAWLDEEDLLPGQHWELEIPKAVRNSDIVLVCLTQHVVIKRGFVQKEVKLALDVADEQPEGTIFVIPVKFEECDVPDRLRHLHWVNLFEEQGYGKLQRALHERASRLRQISQAISPADARSVDAAKEAHSQEAAAKPTEGSAEKGVATSYTNNALLERAAKITKARNYKAERHNWYHSERGRASANDELKNFHSELLRVAKEINKANPEMEIAHEEDNQGFHIFYCLGVSLTTSWNPGRYANSLEGTGLHLKLFDGRISLRAVFTSKEPQVLQHERYNIDLDENLSTVWRETDSKEPPVTSSKLAELWFWQMLHHIENRGKKNG